MSDSRQKLVWDDALVAAGLMAQAPALLGGVVIRASAAEPRRRWLRAFMAMLDDSVPVHRVPPGVSDQQLFGGVDIAATVRSGRRVEEQGLLERTAGGVLIVPMAERLHNAVAARLTQALDDRSQERFGLVLLDESEEGEARPPDRLLDRMALHVDLRQLSYRDCDSTIPCPPTRSLMLPSIASDSIESLCVAGLELGVQGIRPIQLALTVARLAAAAAGRSEVIDDDLGLAARLVLGPRATLLPVPEEQAAEEAPPPEENSTDNAEDGETSSTIADETTQVVIEAAKATIPSGLLDTLQSSAPKPARGDAEGRRGERRRSKLRGRPAGAIRGVPEHGARLNLIETLRAAAPWQPIRRRATVGRSRVAIHIRPDDFRINRHVQKSATTTVFAVDVSGSTALQRLAEAKGAISLMLSDCYVRRDEVSLIAFQGQGAKVLLPATRSLVRANRALTGLPGGGGTPLAAGLQLAAIQAHGARERGRSPVIVVLTDGKANISLQGDANRSQANQDALDVAADARAIGCASLLLDTSPRGNAAARSVAESMGASYMPLPFADSQRVSAAARAVAAEAGPR